MLNLKFKIILVIKNIKSAAHNKDMFKALFWYMACKKYFQFMTKNYVKFEIQENISN